MPDDRPILGNGPPRINPRLQRAYDLRGVVGETLNAADAHGVGLGYAALARRHGLRRIAVSRDGRLSSEVLEAALVQGLLDGGMHVFRMPLGPTPLVSFTIARLGLDGGVMVTGSHNPPDENGFKLHLAGHPLHGAQLDELWVGDPGTAPGGTVTEIDVSDSYLDALAAELDGLPSIGAAWDCGNGATGPVVERLIERLAGSHRVLFAEVDGRFPNHHPDPAVPANLRDLAEATLDGGLDLGIAFDGDGDRIGLVDSAGEIVWADQLLLLLAEDVMHDRPESPIVADVKSSDVLFEGVASLGGRPVMGPSGYVLVRELMLREGAPLAGEMSGHVFFGDRWHHADDALYVAVRTLRALARTGTSLRSFRERLPKTYATAEIRLPCPDERKAEVIEAVRRRAEGDGGAIHKVDGLRVRTPDGWWLLRASGTESKLTARCEAKSPDGLARLQQNLSRYLEEAGFPPAGLVTR
jgi:phosphomannomutase